MSLAARLAALERRTPPAPLPITEAQQDRIARRLRVIDATEGRDGLAVRLTPALGASEAARTADRVAGILAARDGAAS
jgi:hypothetical protein